MSARDQPVLPQQITHASHGHILTNTAVWSPNGEWLVYDVRSDPAGAVFDGTRIERVHVSSGHVEVLYQSQQGACCGVATYHPICERVVFILGPEQPTTDWQYSACHRQGVIVSTDQPGAIQLLDARDLTPPFTPGALRGGTHVHVFSGDGKFVSFTYDDHILNELGRNQRNIGVSLLGTPVAVPLAHRRNHNGEAFSVLVTKTIDNPLGGSDEISRAYEDAWIDNRRLAFLGDVLTAAGETITELFVVELPRDITVEGQQPLAGTETHHPAPPSGTVQRRLTFTTDRKYRGIQGPRHWPRSSPDGSQVAFLMRDVAGYVQLWTISPNGGTPLQVTSFVFDIASAFSWHPNGAHVAAIVDHSVWLINTKNGESRRLTVPTHKETPPRGEACVFSPDGRRIAYVQPVHREDATYNQIFVVETGMF